MPGKYIKGPRTKIRISGVVLGGNDVGERLPWHVVLSLNVTLIFFGIFASCPGLSDQIIEVKL
ncbi:hypothetical protein HYFRA_00005005 [Hymenoscyphus fraxineus]|uniref:Uncharacterized protein n=1 Tax=Hymenoscyphus fraxineus TaxID=746836 RepID=A0A9N9KMF5_9HELO|nr:hypothetical protein HYFRA_00005005 [Hymenoscyphus fraxineus]